MTTERYFTYEGKPLPKEAETYLGKIDRLEKVSIRFSPILRNLYIKYLSLFGIDCYLATTKKNRYSGAEGFFTQLESKLQDAVQVWMCVGEMGFRMMERDEIVEGLYHAIVENGADVKIVKGPRIDIRTKRILDMEKRGLVEIYELSEYPSDHFICVIGKDDSLTLFDEGSHPEVIRGRDEAGEVTEIYSGKHRPFYVIPEPGGLGKKRLKIAQSRVNNSLLLPRPTMNLERGYDVRAVYFEFLIHTFKNFFCQPLSLIWLTLQNLIVYCVKLIIRPFGIEVKKGKEHSNKPDELDLAFRKVHQSEDRLIEAIIANKGMTYKELADFRNSQEGLFFRGGLLHVINELIEQGILKLNRTSTKVVYTGAKVGDTSKR